MKKLACWSKRNPFKARVIIVLCHLMLICIGIFMGVNAYVDDVRIPYGSLLLMVYVFLAAYMLYPERGQKKGIFRYSFARRVKHDFILVLSSTWVLMGGVNNFAFQPIYHHLPEPQVLKMVYKAGSENPAHIKKEFKKSVFAQIKNYRTEIKQQLKAMKAQRQDDGKDTTGLKIVLIFLTLFLAVGLFIGVASLSCSLSCSGHEGLAYLVFFGGSLAIIVGSIIAISKIVRIGKKQRPASGGTEQPVS